MKTSVIGAGAAPYDMPVTVFALAEVTAEIGRAFWPAGALLR
jgi:hypothetical protein